MKTQSGTRASSPRRPRGTHSTRPVRVLATVAIGFLVLTDGSAAKASNYTITVDASTQTAGNPHFWSAAFGTGKAKLVLRSDWQTHNKIGARELGAQRVRGHGLLNDEMGLYKAAGSYDWTNLDTYLLAITSAGMRPVMELDFMPTALATGDMHSPPKDYNAWKDFIKSLAQHCVDKYGADDVGQWYWEVWNEPDYAGFWANTDMNAYYTLYDNTVAALTSVLPNVLVGGPATTGPSPINAFLKHCKSAGTRVTFASSHVYPGGDGTKTSSTSADATTLVNDNNSRVSAITGAGYTTSDVKSFNTEWNSSYSGQGGNPADVVKSMDNHWNVGFILKGVKLLSDKNSGNTAPLDMFSYWVLSDVFDEDSGTDGIHMTTLNNGSTPFGQVFGLMTYQGLRKAAFNAFKLLNYLGPKRLKSAGGTGNDGVDAMATTSDSGDSLQILVYDYYKTMNTTGSDNVTVSVSNLPSALAGKQVYVTQFLVDETHSNPYSVWQGEGSPGSPSEADWEKMRDAQHLALYPNTNVGDTKTVDTTFSTSFALNRQAGTLIIVSIKRPLTGRDAKVEIEGEDYDGQSGSSTIKEDSGDSTTLGQSVSLASGAWVYFDNVDFSDDGVGSVQLRVKSQSDTSLELHQDSPTGTLLAKCTVSNTANAWASQTCTLSQTSTGVASKLYVVAGGALHLNYLKFQPGNAPPGTGGTGGGGTTGGGSGGTTGSSSGGTTGSSSGGTTGSSSGGSTGTSSGGAGGNRAGGGTTGSSSGGATGSPSGGSTGASSGGAGGNRAGGGTTGSSNGGATGSPSGGSTGTSGGGTTGSSNGGATGSSSAGATGSSNGGSGGPRIGGSGNGGSGGGGNSGSGGSSTGGGGAASGCSCGIGNTGGGPSGTLLIVGLVTAVLGLRKRKARRRG